MNFLFTLRQLGQAEPNLDKRYLILGAATQLQEAIKDLWDDPTVENMTNVNNLWAYASRVMELASPPREPTPPTATGAAQGESYLTRRAA